LARLYTDENFPLPVVEFLRGFGHDVLTARDAGKANQKISDEEVLAFATITERSLLTLNRRDFIQLHRLQPEHAGVIVCTEGSDFESQAMRIHKAISAEEDMKGKLVRVNRPSA
jgi:predicted nuclease of predicted toxin-antitoxin system